MLGDDKNTYESAIVCYNDYSFQGKTATRRTLSPLKLSRFFLIRSFHICLGENFPDY